MNGLTAFVVVVVAVAGASAQGDPRCPYFERCRNRFLGLSLYPQCPLPCCPGKMCCPNANCQMTCVEITPLRRFDGRSMMISCPTQVSSMVDCNTRHPNEYCDTDVECEMRFNVNSFCCKDPICGGGYCYNTNSIGSAAALIGAVGSPGYVDPSIRLQGSVPAY